MIAYTVSRNHNVVYVGITSNGTPQKRWTKHLWDAANGIGWAFHNAIRKYGESDFIVEHVVSARTWEDLCAVERVLIEQHGTFADDGLGGYNMTRGGEGGFGQVRSEETRRKLSERIITDLWRSRMRESHIGGKLSEEHKRNIGEANRGRKLTPEQAASHCRKHTPETIAKMRANQKTPEHLAKISAALKGRQLTSEHVAKMRAMKPSAETRAKVSAAISGRVWMTNGVEDRQVPADTTLGPDWRRGRSKVSKRWIVALPLLLGACASWPSGSYEASISDGDASVLAPAIANYIAGAVPAGTPVSVEPERSGGTLGPKLASSLDHDGIPQDPSGRRVQYIAQPLDSGVMLRVSIDNREGGSQYFARSGASLQPNGPMMVALP